MYLATLIDLPTKNSPWIWKLRLCTLKNWRLEIWIKYLPSFFKCHSISGSVLVSVCNHDHRGLVPWMVPPHGGSMKPKWSMLGHMMLSGIPKGEDLEILKNPKDCKLRGSTWRPKIYFIGSFFCFWQDLVFGLFFSIWSLWGVLINEVVGWQTLETQQLENRIVESMKRWRFRQWQPDFDPESVDLKSPHSLSDPTSQSLTDTFPIFFGWVPIGEGVDSPRTFFRCWACVWISST